MMRRGSLVQRIVIPLGLLVLGFAAVAAATGSITLRREIKEAMDTTLREAARRLVPVVIDDLYNRDPTTTNKLAEAAGDEDGDRLVFQVRDKQGRVILHSYHAPAEPLTSDLAPGFTDTPEWRIYTEPAVSGSIVVQMAEHQDRRDEETLEAAMGFLLPIGLLVPVTALLTWLILRRALSPISALRGQIGARHGHNLAPILTDGLPTELGSIAKSVNSLMRRLRMALDGEKEFTANAAHELRTPIAGALAQTERLIAEAPNEATRTRAFQVRDALTHLARLSEKLLQLARVDAGIAMGGSAVDLATVVRLVVDEQAEPRRARLQLTVPSESVTVDIDPDTLAIVARNLIENALRHGAAGEPIRIEIGTDATLRVVNAGAIVPPDMLAGLMQRFARGASDADGSGLGLAIVSRIVQQVGGTLALHSPATRAADGFEAVAQFPSAPKIISQSAAPDSRRP